MLFSLSRLYVGITYSRGNCKTVSVTYYALVGGPSKFCLKTNNCISGKWLVMHISSSEHREVVHMPVIAETLKTAAGRKSEDIC